VRAFKQTHPANSNVNVKVKFGEGKIPVDGIAKKVERDKQKKGIVK